MATRPLVDCLEKEPGTARLISQAERLLRLQRIFRRTLPGNFADLGRVANYKLGLVVIHAINGAAAARIRQVAPRIADGFRKEGMEVTEIRVKVQPSETASARRAQKNPLDIGEKGKQALTNFSQKLPHDDPLRQALEHLLARAKP